MRQISFQSVEMSNFKSFAHARVDLRRGPGLRMVFGENRREPRLGANGAGKSTIWDAVEFCLSGRSVRGKRASELVTTGEKSMWVETGWLVDDEVLVVRRSFSPERVYVDGEQANQARVDGLLGLTRERRLASVLFGQAKPLFMDMPAPERGDLLDETLGLGFWMRAADLATQRWNGANLDLVALQRDLARLEGALGELPDGEELEHLADEHDARVAREVADLGEQRRELDAELRVLRRGLTRLGDPQALLADAGDRRDALRTELSALSSSAAVLRADAERLAGDIEFFEENAECPSCGQEISGEHSGLCIARFERDMNDKLALLAASDAARAALDEREGRESALISELREAVRARGAAERDVATKRGSLGILDNRIALLRGQTNPHRDRMAEVAARRSDLEARLGARRAEESALSSRIADLDYWRQGFRRVRIYCLSRVLAELEVETMSAARSLGLVGWRIGFTGETETKLGTVKLGVRAVVESPEARRDFDAWSPGEGQRVRVASSLGLASLIQRYSGVSYDLECWDEPSAWLSEEGVEDLFECLRSRAHSRGKSIWVCDPRAGVANGAFDEAWSVVKDDDGSRIEVVRPDRGGVA